MRGYGAILCHDGPVVVEYLDVIGSEIDHRFDCEDHTGFESWVRAARDVVWNLRFLVDGESYAVAAIRPDDTVAIGLDGIEHGTGNVLNTAAGVGRSDSIRKGLARHPQELIDLRTHRSYRE